jgi:outer membrane receptor protein involved in Fe transport
MDSIHVYKDKSDVFLGDIKLNEATTALNEIIIYAEKPLIENKDGKLIFNVAESPLSSGSSASELLRNLPLMNVNPDGTLLMQGKTPLILMDEKPVNLSGQQLSDLLESLPASVIEKVEIMSNPPPEYATYPGGVINIITKKGRIGIYERIGISVGSKGEKGISGNFNYRSSQLNLTTSIGVGNVLEKGNSYSHRENFYKDSVNYFYSKTVFSNRNTYPNMRIQADYDFNKHTSASLVYQGNLNYYNKHSAILSSNLDSDFNVYKANARTNQYDGDGNSHSFSSSYEWKGKNPVEKIQLWSGLSFSKNNNDRDFYQQFLQSNFLPTGLDSTQVQLTDNYVRSFYFSSKYNMPLNDTGTIFISTGASYTINAHHNILSTSYLDKIDNNYITDEMLSNNFYFDQSIITLRTALVLILPKKMRIVTGVQGEQTLSDFKFVKGNSADANNAYLRLLPSVTLFKEFNKQFNTTLVYRETIRRPGIIELNPNIDYSDPYNIRFGNPLLTPALTSNFDLNVSYVKSKFNLNANLGYSQIKNVFSSIRTLIDSGKTQTTYQNISDQEEFSGSMWAGITVTRKFRVNVSGGYIYYKFSEREKLLYKYVNGATEYATINYSYSPTKLTTIEANNRYGSYVNPQGKSNSNINIGLSVMHKFLNKKLIASLSAYDLFGSQTYRGYSEGTHFKIDSYSQSNTQNFRLSISYQISKSILKSKLDDKQKKEALDKLSHK